MAPLAGPSVGVESFGRGENIGEVVQIPLAIVATGQALDGRGTDGRGEDGITHGYSDSLPTQASDIKQQYHQQSSVGMPMWASIHPCKEG